MTTLRCRCLHVQDNVDPVKGKFSEDVYFGVTEDATRGPLAPGGTTTRLSLTIIAPGPFGQYVEGAEYDVKIAVAVAPSPAA